MDARIIGILQRADRANRMFQDAYDNAYEAIYQWVEAHGGIIDTQDIENKRDKLYAYGYTSTDCIEEYRAVALRVTKGTLEVFLDYNDPSLKFIRYTIEDIKKSEDYCWESLDGTSYSVLGYFTVLSIIEFITQYGEDKK